jgi:hypothetical protein
MVAVEHTSRADASSVIFRFVGIGQAANPCYPASRTTTGSTIVSEPTVAEAIESIYTSLQSDNLDLDAHIAILKAALNREGVKEAFFDPTRLAQSNRSGRKLMQAYFRQRGVRVTFLPY